jgi:small-conductance mechanosensitive channel
MNRVNLRIDGSLARLSRLRPLCLIVVAAWGLAGGTQADAAEGAAHALADSDRVTVRVDGRAVFRVGSADGEDAAARAARIERRIQALRDKPEAIGPVVVERSGTDGMLRMLTVSGVPVVTINPEDAQDNLTGIDSLAAQWSAALDRALQRAKQQRQTSWGRFRSDVQGAVQTAFSRLGESALTVIPRVLAALLVLLLFWGLAAVLRWLMRTIFHRIISDLTLENLIKQVVYYAVWVLGFIVAVDALGWDPQAIATALGLTGLALGFALKDVLSNFVSGLILLASRPFEVHDQIIVGRTEGTIERIMLRATQIRTYDGRLVLVPNAEIFTNRITNNTASPVRRGSVQVFLGYDQDLSRTVEVLRQAAAGTEGVLEDPPANVRVADLGQSDIVLELRFWADSRRSDFVATGSLVREAVVAAMKHAGIGLPDPNVRFLSPRHADQWRQALGSPSDTGGPS